MKRSNFSALFILAVVVSTMLFSQAVIPTYSSESIMRDYMNSQDPVEYWPTNEWQTSTPEDQGMDSSKLDEAMDYIDDNDVRCDGLVVIRNGYIVYEEYPSSRYNSFTLHRLYSTTKSVLSALVGIALDNGNISSLDTPVLDFFPDITPENPSPEKEMMTLRHLLTMTSGIEWDEHSISYSNLANPIGMMSRNESPPQYFLDRPMAATPGEEWVYNSGGSLLISYIIYRTTGLMPLDFAFEYLFDPLGIENANWLTDSTGMHSGSGELFLKPRDLAKIGYLFMNNGTWEDQRVISSNWVNQSTTHLTEDQRASSYIGYGLHWWTVPDLNLYFTAGLYGQEMYIDTTNDLIVVFTGSVPVSKSPPWLGIMNQYILPSLDSGGNSVTTNVDTLGLTIMVLVVALPAIVTSVYWIIVSKKIRTS